MRHLVVAVAVLGCAGKKDDTPAPQPVVVAGSGSAAAPARPDPTCVDATTKLGRWLAQLDAESSSTALSDGLKLVKLDAEAPRSIADAPTLFVSVDKITFEGSEFLIGSTAERKHIEASLAANKASDLLIVVDGATAWSVVMALAAAAAHADHTHVTFVFAAGAPGKATPPPPSAVDKEPDQLTKPADPSKPAPKLWASKDPNRPPTVGGKIFKDCQITDAFTEIGNAETSADKTKAIVEGLPRAIAACNCKVEIASVQRLVWSWYDRDTSPAVVGVGVDLAVNGTAVTAKPTAPWSDAGKTLAAAAKAGKPLVLK